MITRSLPMPTAASTVGPSDSGAYAGRASAPRRTARGRRPAAGVGVHHHEPILHRPERNVDRFDEHDGRPEQDAEHDQDQARPRQAATTRPSPTMTRPMARPSLSGQAGHVETCSSHARPATISSRPIMRATRLAAPLARCGGTGRRRYVARGDGFGAGPPGRNRGRKPARRPGALALVEGFSETSIIQCSAANAERVRIAGFGALGCAGAGGTAGVAGPCGRHPGRGARHRGRRGERETGLLGPPRPPGVVAE